MERERKRENERCSPPWNHHNHAMVYVDDEFCSVSVAVHGSSATFCDAVVCPPHSTVELFDKGEESEEEDSEELVSLDKIDELATMLKTISVDVDKLPVAYASIAQVVNNLSELLRSTFRRE